MELSLLRTDKEITQAYETYVDMVYRLCFTILKNQFDTEDAVQNTFVKLMRYPKRFDSPEHEKAWLFVTASNTCKDALRRTSRREEPLEAQTDLPAPPDSDPVSRAVLEAVLALPLTSITTRAIQVQRSRPCSTNRLPPSAIIFTKRVRS